MPPDSLRPPTARPWGAAVTDTWLLAGLTFRDLRRNVGAWRLPMVSAALFAVLFLTGAVVATALQDRAQDLTFRTALDGDRAGAEDLVAALAAAPHLTPGEVVDAADSVARRKAAAGLTLPPGLDAEVAAGAAVTLPLHQRPDSTSSREGAGWLTLALHEALGTGDLPVVRELDVADDPDANRERFAGSLAGLTAFLALGVVTSVSSVLGGTRERRGADALLVLPVPRPAVAAGAALGALPMGAAYIATGLTLLLGASLLPLPTLDLSAGAMAGAVPLVVVGAALLAGLAAALGAVGGALGGGSDDAMSLGDLLAMPLAAVGVLLVLVPDLSAGPLTALVPGVGPVLVVRDAVAGRPEPLVVAVAALATVGWSAALLTVAGRLLRSERNIRRA